MNKSEPDELELKTVDDAIFEIEDYIGGNIEGQETIDRMGLTVFLRKVLSEQSRKAYNEGYGVAEEVFENSKREAVVGALEGLKGKSQDDASWPGGEIVIVEDIDQAIERYRK